MLWANSCFCRRPDVRSGHRAVHQVTDVTAQSSVLVCGVIERWPNSHNPLPRGIMMNLTLTAEIYSPRWGHTDRYTFELTREAMTISMLARKGKCTWRDNLDPVWTGESLEDMLRNDMIYPPSIFPALVEHLWKSWRNGEIDSSHVDSELQEIIVWLNKITEVKPKTDFWKRYF